MSEQWILELIKTAGVATPLVFFLWRILDREHDERKGTQEKFVTALGDQSKLYVDLVRLQTEAGFKMAEAGTALAHASTEAAERHSTEHTHMMELIRLESIERRGDLDKILTAIQQLLQRWHES